MFLNVEINDEHRESDHFAIVSIWKYDFTENTEDFKSNRKLFSVWRTMKNPKAIKAYTEKVNQICKNLQNMEPDPQSLLTQTIDALKKVACACFPNQRTKAVQTHAVNHNLIGYNKFV